MHIGRSYPHYEYRTNGVVLIATEEEKDVGVWIIKNLKPSEQCQKAVTRGKAVLNQLAQNFHY
jgi:hypothetical protein